MEQEGHGTMSTTTETPRIPDDIAKGHMLLVAVSEIGGCLTDLGRVIRQGIRVDNEAARGSIALGLERAACLVRGQSIATLYPPSDVGRLLPERSVSG